MSGRPREVLTIRDVFAICDKFRAQGKNVIDAHIGAPSHEPPLPVEDVLARVGRVGRQYTPFSGLRDVREAAAEFASRTLGVKNDPERVVITASGAHACFVSLALFRGGKVLLPRPGFPLYYPQAELAGLEYETYDPLAEDLVAEILSKLDDKVRAVMMNFPNNPTGHVPPGRVLEELWEELQAKKVTLINDAVYHEIYYGSRPSFPGDILLDTSSKSLSLPGIRMGYIYAHDKEVATRAGKIVYHTTAGSSDVSQRIFAEELRAADETYFDGVRAYYKVRRDKLVSSLKNLGFEFVEPLGAFYIFAKHPRFSDASNLISRLLSPDRDVIVGIVPGEAFGSTPEWFRISFGKLSPEHISIMAEELRRELS
ncbi:MAG TPA: pyridoxal phosphate-dependent aminotransferase [Candidatus Korarchaeota archaeon]|nr:pyridoxal phosphate-dependent aminotransferase [Candidatus Korarchaeota archaeon]